MLPLPLGAPADMVREAGQMRAMDMMQPVMDIHAQYMDASHMIPVHHPGPYEILAVKEMEYDNYKLGVGRDFLASGRTPETHIELSHLNRTRDVLGIPEPRESSFDYILRTTPSTPQPSFIPPEPEPIEFRVTIPVLDDVYFPRQEQENIHERMYRLEEQRKKEEMRISSQNFFERMEEEREFYSAISKPNPVYVPPEPIEVELPKPIEYSPIIPNIDVSSFELPKPIEYSSIIPEPEPIVPGLVLGHHRLHECRSPQDHRLGTVYSQTFWSKNMVTGERNTIFRADFPETPSIKNYFDIMGY